MQSRFGVGQPGADLVAAQDQRHPVVDAVHRGIGRGGQNHKPIGPIRHHQVGGEGVQLAADALHAGVKAFEVDGGVDE